MEEIERGWHRDPHDDRQYRWHDGRKFTQFTSLTQPTYPLDPGWYRHPDDPDTGDMWFWDGRNWTKSAPLDHEAVTERPKASEGPPSGLWVLLVIAGGSFTVAVIVLLLLILGGRGEQTEAQDTTTTTAACVAAEFDLAPGAPDPCAPSTIGDTTSTSPTQAPTTTATSSEPIPAGRFTRGRLLDPGPITWAISYDYQILDNTLEFSVVLDEGGESATVVGFGEVLHRNQYEAEQPFPDSDEVGTVRRLFTAVTVFVFEGTWDGDDQGRVEGTVAWNQPVDRIDVEYNESTVGEYPEKDGIFSGPGPPGGAFTATWSQTTGQIQGEATVDPWGVLAFDAYAYVVDP